MFEEYRMHVGPPGWYDIVGASQFAVLTMMGLREEDDMLDIGCGSIRLGRFCIVYLAEGRYYGLEPAKEILEQGIEANLGREIVERKKPVFDHNDQFDLGVFGKRFKYIVAQSIFSHAAKHQIAKCLKEAYNVLDEDGLFMFNWGKGDEDYTGDEWVYPDCTFFRTDTVESLIRDAGLAYRHKRFPFLPLKTDWTVTARNEQAFEKIGHIPEQ